MENIFPMTNEEKQQLGNLAIGEIVLLEKTNICVQIFLFWNMKKSLLGLKE